MLNEGLGVASGVFVADRGMASLNMWECKRDLRGMEHDGSQNGILSLYGTA